MKYFIIIFNIIINFFYLFFKLLPTKKNKIFFLSRQTENPSIDYRMLIEEIEQNFSDYKIVVTTRKIKKNFKDVLFKNTGILFKQMYHLATSKVCVIDGYNISISMLHHKKDLTVIQIWHSLAAIKKFGYQSLDTNKKKIISKYMKMHKNYNYIISGSNAMIPYFAESFGYDVSRFKSLGLPRIDYLLNNKKINKQKIYKKYPELRKKKTILYAPTFRDNNHYEFAALENTIDHDKYNFIMKIHPNIQYTNTSNKTYTCDEFTTLQLLSIADYVITDYSAVSIEAAVLDIPTFLYVYDYDEYKEYPGINIDLYAELPGYVFKNPKELYQCIKKQRYDTKSFSEFKNKYVANTKGNVTKTLAKFIIEGCEKA